MAILGFAKQFWLPLALIAVIGAAYVKGRSDGRSVERERIEEARDALQAEIDHLVAENNSLVEKVLDAEERRRAATEAAEEAARADPDAINRRPKPDSLQRLERLWGAPD